MTKKAILQHNASTHYNLPKSMQIDPEPIEVIHSASSGLRRPEDIAFAPDGGLKAVANSKDSSITLYARIGCTGCGYESDPHQVIRYDPHLNYVHGIDFSPDGRYLVSVARGKHTLTLFRLYDPRSEVLNPSPLWTVSGSEYGLEQPASVAFHPTGRNFVVANRGGSYSISFFGKTRDETFFGWIPARSVHREMLGFHGLASASCLTYSRDGERLYTGHSRYGRNDQGTSGIAVFDYKENGNRLTGPMASKLIPNMNLHSLTVHPFKKYLGYTTSNGDSFIAEYNDHPFGVKEVSCIKHHKPELSQRDEGPKGISFTRCATRLEICNSDDEITVFKVTS